MYVEDRTSVPGSKARGARRTITVPGAAVAASMTIGERVAWYRRRRGISQAVCAGLVGRSEDWLAKIESGRRNLDRLSLITALSDVLRVSVGDLVAASSPDPRAFVGGSNLPDDERVVLAGELHAVRGLILNGMNDAAQTRLARLASGVGARPAALQPPGAASPGVGREGVVR